MKAGFHLGIPAAKYHADCAPQPSLSSSTAKTLLTESPCKAWYSSQRLNPEYRDDRDPKFDRGTAAHSMILEDDDSKLVIVQADDWRTKAAKEQRDQANAAGKTAILERHFDSVKRMVLAALAFIKESEIAEYWPNAESEVTSIWTEGGIWKRARFDRITKDRRVIIDYKSTTDASPDVFSRQIPRMHYHIQEAFYRDAVVAHGHAEPKFVFLAQADEPPHECSLHGCDPAMQEIAEAEVKRATDIWRQCITSGKWPSYGGRIHWTAPTAWMMQDHEMRLAEAA